jgi:superfamily II DNA or RNA helicase
MPEQSTSTVCGMSFRKNPRDGQRKVFNAVEDYACKAINVQLPTGYGKSFVNAGVYSILKKQNRVNRLLIVVPTAAQNEQYFKDGPDDMEDACVDGNSHIYDIQFYGTQAIKKHRSGKGEIFIITIQALINNSKDIVTEMMKTGKWMVTVDEYHHYGYDKVWGNSVKNLSYSFLLAMSATPYRKGDDGAFGAPDIVVSYRDAVEDGCVKKLCGHSYTYRIEALKENGDAILMTTDELILTVGSNNPDNIEAFLIKRKMRWSPKYVYPLVLYPIERMLNERIKTGHKLQVIIGAMCVSHAEMVCKQVTSMFPDLKIDWVGTGNNGRKSKENQKILEKFCPKKNNRGEREPTLDILVHVGMAGEGLDSVNVSEIVHLNNAAINNSNNQENGRAARYLPGVVGNINFDSCSEYSTKDYKGSAIMDAMDNVPPTEEEADWEEIETDLPNEGQLPEDPGIQIWNMELDNIDSGDPEVQKMAQILANNLPKKYQGVKDIRHQLEDKDSELFDWAIEIYKESRERECKQYNEEAKINQLQESVALATSTVARAVRKLRINKGLFMDSKKYSKIIILINTKKARLFGKICSDEGLLLKHYHWIRDLEREIISTKRIPSWLL